MPWVDLSAAFGFQTVLTSTQMQNLRDNLAAMMAGNAGAPRLQSGAITPGAVDTTALAASSVTGSKIGTSAVDTAQLAASAVTQSKLSTTSSTYTASGSNRILYASSAGAFGFFPQIAAGTTVTPANTLNSALGWSTARAKAVSFGANPASEENYGGANFTTSYQTLFFVHGTHLGGFTTTTVRQYNVIASPPFDLGDGEIPCFIFVLIDKASANVIGVSMSSIPPWAYNGPTCIQATRYARYGRSYRRVFIPSHISRDSEQKLKRDLIAYGRTPLKDRIRDEGEYWEIEIDDTWKNADMDLLPSPMRARSDQAMVMLDPMSLLCQRLGERMEDGDDVSRLIHDKEVRIDNTPIASRKSPPGVPVHGLRLR